MAALASSRFLSRCCCTVDVVDRFGHHPRKFLEMRKPVEFERIESGVLLVGDRRVRLHLQFGLHFNFAQLAAQTDDVLRQFQQGFFQVAHLAFDTRTGDGQLARFVDQAVDDAGAHAQHRLRMRRFAFGFRRRYGRRFGVAGRRDDR